MPAPGIGDMLTTARSAAEYRAMFALTASDLRGRILDCPGGASSFTAETADDGGDVTACDPVYADVTGLEARALAETDRGNRYAREHPGLFRWSFFDGPDQHRRIRRAAVRRFAADTIAHPGRYVAGALPHLPFSGGAFDLVLCSHLLFTYADRFGLAFHRAAVLEMLRAGREVRIFPLVATGQSVVHPLVAELRDDLGAYGVHTMVSDVDYEFQAGGRGMLVGSHPG